MLLLHAPHFPWAGSSTLCPIPNTVRPESGSVTLLGEVMPFAASVGSKAPEWHLQRLSSAGAPRSQSRPLPSQPSLWSATCPLTRARSSLLSEAHTLLANQLPNILVSKEGPSQTSHSPAGLKNGGGLLPPPPPLTSLSPHRLLPAILKIWISSSHFDFYFFSVMQ